MENIKLNLTKLELDEAVRGLFDYLNYLHFIFEEEKSNEINLNFEENTTKILNLVNLINKKIENKEEILLSSEETDLILKGLDSTIFWLEKYKNDSTEEFTKKWKTYFEEIKEKAKVK